MEYKISIVIPVYNAAVYLPDAMASLEQQTIGFAQLEILLVDDCSTDDSYAVAQGYAAQYPNVTALQTEKNSGHAGAPRNLGLRHVHAPYLMFLDSDDTLALQACEALHETAEREAADCVTGYYRETDEILRPIEEKNHVCREESKRVYHLPQDLLAAMDVNFLFCCKIYRTAIVKENDIEFLADNNMEDVFYLLKYLQCSEKLVYIDQCIVNYRMIPTSISHGVNAAYISERGDNYRKIYEIYKDMNHLDCFYPQAYRLLAHYFAAICDAPRIEPQQRVALLQKWEWLAGITLHQPLLIENAHQRLLFEQMEQEHSEIAVEFAPLYYAWKALHEQVQILDAENTRREAALESFREAATAMQAELNRKEVQRQSLVAENQELEREKQAIADERGRLQGDVERLRQDSTDVRAKLAEVEGSRSHRLGCALTAPLRKIKQLLRR